MSRETAIALNTNTLIGMTAERGMAWHYRADLQGAESNHYSGAIPVADIARRLFSWSPVKVPLFAQVPTDLETATTVDADGNPVLTVALPGRIAIVRSDTNAALGVFKDGYNPHDYNQWLTGTLSNLVGDTLIVSSAGTLKGGAQAWVEISVPDTIHDAKSGIDYRPNLLAASSLDGSLATTYARTITNTVCDNTMSIALMEGRSQQYKIKHSRHSGLKIEAARSALSLVTETADEFQAQIDYLTTTTVTDAQLSAFLDLWAPVPADKGRAATRAENKRDGFMTLYRNDNRVAPWSGTAYGVIQGVNTFAHHIAEVRGGTRAERNMSAAITGKIDEIDTSAWNMVSSVLELETV